jgi:prophage antirepressor-like protein
MNELTIFNFEEEQEVRTLELDGELWFVAKDVCDILGLGNARETISNFPEDERNTVSSTDGIHEGPGNPNVNIINEPGLYRLIFQSRKPEAERFKRWVFHEVLPAIRKTGAYSILKRDHRDLQNVYNQMENYRIKYINLLDKLENEGMTIEEIWKLSRIDRMVLQKMREILPGNCEKYRG